MSSSRFKPTKSAATNAMLLSVSFYVIFTTLPATLVYVLSAQFPEGDHFDAACQLVDMANDRTWRRFVVFFTVSKVVNEICLSHYACNCFLFAITGLEFRRELCRTLRCRSEQSQRSSANNENGDTEYTMTTVGRTHGRDSLPSPEPEELRSFVPAAS